MMISSRSEDDEDEDGDSSRSEEDEDGDGDEDYLSGFGSGWVEMEREHMHIWCGGGSSCWGAVLRCGRCWVVPCWTTFIISRKERRTSGSVCQCELKTRERFNTASYIIITRGVVTLIC